ncbi:MAG: prepilin peptidase [Alphaproteobacteria bacterium]
MDVLLYFILVLLTVTLLGAAVYDLTRFTLPNQVSWAVAGLFAVTAAAHFSLPVMLSHLASGAVVFAVTYGLWQVRVMGGGDVKFWAATALWFELPQLPHQLFAVALSGGVVALVLISLRRGLARYMRTADRRNEDVQLPRGLQVGGPVPYGVAIAAGTLWALFTSAPGYFATVLTIG